MPLDLIPDEHVIFERRREGLTLTSHRVLYQTQVGGQTHTVSIMLEDLCSCSASRTDFWALLIVGAVFAVLGIIIAFVATQAGFAVGGIVLGVVFLLIYFGSRRTTLALASAAAVIRVSTSGMKPAEIAELVRQVAQAKDARFQLHRFTYPQPVT